MARNGLSVIGVAVVAVLAGVALLSDPRCDKRCRNTVIHVLDHVLPALLRG
jgi:hypothetical protein